MLLNKLTERMSQKVAGGLFCNDKDGPVLCNYSFEMQTSLVESAAAAAHQQSS